MASTLRNGSTNGSTHHDNHAAFERFQDIPSVIDIPVRGDEGDEAVNLDLTELHDDIDELCDLLENENAAKSYWATIALAYAKQNKVDIAIEIIRKGLSALSRAKPEDKLSLLTVLCWLQLCKARHAARVPIEGEKESKTKDTWLQAATGTLNEASRINPSYPPLYLARGVLSLLRAPLLEGRAGVASTRDAFVQASKGFDDALRHARGNNVMALMGKAKTVYSLGRYAEALQLYQKALESSPDLLNPDPRIGIGCCLWQLGHKEAAHQAWERAHELNPQSAIAHQLIGLYYLDQTSQHQTGDEVFGQLYKEAMTNHTQAAFKLDANGPLTCATFGSYFLLRKQWPNVEKLAKRAIELTDTPTIASDGWYLRARQAHYQGDYSSAADCYAKSDQARGGDEKGYLPAKFGLVQLRTMQKDFDGAKFRLEKMLTQNKSVDVQILLGMLYAEEVFASYSAATREDKFVEKRKAIALLEQVRTAWRDPKRKLEPDSAVLLSLARLYELVSPQLLNNIGCFQFQAEKYSLAREYFQSALSGCVKRADEPDDTDALVTTISYNLARTYEAEGLDDEARNVYSSLLQRHPDYTDASLRLAYISLNSDASAGVTSLKALMDADPSNLEVRTLYGWYINKAKKRTLALNEDQEQRHYKHTLQNYDKHDLYALTGMGNVHLAVAREMPRQTDQDKERRSKIYMRAVEFFDKVLTLDPKNAYAAQGMAIALVEDKKDKTHGIQIFSKVRESIRDASVYINLGHLFADVGQFARSIENYEAALNKLKSTDPHQATLLSCLGRVWLSRGKAERAETRLESFRTSLVYSQRALEAAKGAKDEVNYRFNIAFVQIQIAQLINQLSETQRSLEDVQTASRDLDEAIEAFSEIAKSPNPPFPPNDIEQRANMGRNTMKRQLATAIEKQEEYENKNAAKLEEARHKREEEMKRREEAKAKAEAEAEEKRRLLREERERILEQDREALAKRQAEEREREEAEMTTDAETGERKKREKKRGGDKKQKKRKKKTDSSDEEGDFDGSGDDAPKRSRRDTPGTDSALDDGEPARPRQKKKRRLEKKSAKQSKYKSSELVQDSSDDDAGEAQVPSASNEVATPAADDDEQMEDGEAATASKVRRPARVLDDEDDDE